MQSGTAGEGVCLGEREGGKGEGGESRPRPLPCEAAVRVVVACDTRRERAPPARSLAERVSEGLTLAISPGMV